MIPFKLSRSEITFAAVVAILLVLFAGYRIYLSTTTLLICGDRISKFDFKSVFITVSNHMYEVDNHKFVVELAESVSHFPKHGQIQLTTTGQVISPGSVLKSVSYFALTTQPNRYRSSTYEGFMYSNNHEVIWSGGTNGDFWMISRGFVNLLESIAKSPETKRIS